MSLDDNAVRRRLIDGNFLASAGDALPAGMRLRSDDELARSLAQTLAAHPRGEDVHVFGCGSLMWNPALDATLRGVARLRGWHRRFCFRTLIGRGSPERPGVMLALDRGGACSGLLLRIAADKADDELRLLWRREMATGSYQARWVRVGIDGERVPAIAFVADQRNERYLGALPDDELVRLIRSGTGARGSTRDYFDATVAALARLRIRDGGIERLRRAVAAADAGDAPAALTRA